MPTGSAPAGASGNPATSGPRASAYQPANQPGADALLQSISAAFLNNGGTNPGATPGGWAYPYAQSAIQSVVDPNNPYLQQAVNAGETAYQAFNPFSQIPGWIMQNLYGYQGQIPQMLGTAQQVAGYAPQLAGSASQILSQGGALDTAVGRALSDPTSYLLSGGNQILQTAFDPQGALQAQLEAQVRNQAQAANAAAGLGGTAYGAGQVGNTLSNFDINWQNQQLARQAQGLQAAGGAYGQFGQLQGIPLQLLESATTSAINPLAAAGNLATAPASALTAAFGPLGTGANSAASILSQGQSFAGLPYSTLNTGVSNILGNLGQGVNIGNQQFTIPQQFANDLQSYLGLGQAASQLSGQLGAAGQQELFNSLSGLGGAANLGSQALFGQSLFGGSGSLLGNQGGLLGLAGLNPLFSSAGSAATDFGGSVLPAGLGFPAASLGGGFGFDAAGTALAGATDFGGGADFAGSLIPLLLAA